RSLERAAVPEKPLIGRGPRYLVHPEIAIVCAPSLHAIAAVLRDESYALDEDALENVRYFVTGPSPFFGRDVTAALREAVRLQHTVLGSKAPVPGVQQVDSTGGEVPYPSAALTGA